MADDILIPRGTPRIQFTADGAQTAFSYPFPVFQADDLEVYLDAAPQSTGFVVTGAGQTEGGTVSFAAAPADGTLVTLRRRVITQRVSDFLESGPLPAAALNSEFDRLTAGLQQLADDLALTLHYAATDLPASAELPGRTLRANRLLSFDSGGNPSVELPGDTDNQISYVPAGAGAVERPVRDKLRDAVSIKDFGAAGDGVSDDTLAIQTALASAMAVHVPPGTYVISQSLTVEEGRTLFGDGQSSVIRGTGHGFDLIRVPASYATVRDLKLENGAAGVRLFGDAAPCVQNSLLDLTIWDADIGLVLDGYTRTDRPCYWNNIARVLVARPATHGVWLTRSGTGDTPNANKFLSVRVYSLSAPISGSGFYVEHGRFNNAFIDCEANLSTGAHSCFRLGADTDKNLLVNLYCETLGAVPNLVIGAGSVETSIVNLFSASAGPAIEDFSGGQYTAYNAGHPTKNRLRETRITDLVVEAFRYDTEFYDPVAGGVFEPDLTSSVYLVSGFNGAVEVRLPAPEGRNGQVVTVKKTDGASNPVTVTASTGTGPDGREVVLGNRYDFVTMLSNGAAWHVTAASGFPGSTRFHEGEGLVQPDLTATLYLISAFAGPVEVRLPVPQAPHAVGRTLTVKKSDPSDHVVTVTVAAGSGPDGEAIVLGAIGHALTAMSDGGGWHILARYP